MPDLPLPLSSAPGARLGEANGRLVCAYAEQSGGGTFLRRVPGISTLATVSGSGPRGMIELDGFIYIAYSGAVVRMAKDGSSSTVLTGALPGTDGVTFARNNRVTAGASTPDLVAVRSTGGAYVVTDTAVSAYASPNLPANVVAVAFLGGFLVFAIEDGRIFASELNSLTVNALSFATAEAAPDGLVRGIVHAGRFYAMGQSTIEIWMNQGFQPFPLGRAPTVIQVGLKAPMAVAGTEAEWGRSPIFVASDDTVRVLSGHDTQVVSTPPVDRFITSSDPATLEACVFTFRGNAHWALSSNIGTWVLDVASGRWHERKSDGIVNWRASRSIKSDERWLVGDRLSGKVGLIQEGVRTEHGAPLAAVIESAPLRNYPARIAIPALFLHFTESDGCSAAISWSQDGEKTWEGPVTRPLDGADRDPIRVNSIGQTTHHGLRVRVAISDDADFSLMGASVPDPQVKAP